ncbi:MAG TPA: M48 family metallopeptidase [Methylomirabilota bacterium]|nr:M48 family metallopeptidase [Methylomirabilota bacterium]
MSRRITAGIAIAALAVVWLAACSTTTEQGAVGVERKQLLLVSSAEMDQAASAAYQNVLKEQTPKGNVNKDPQQTERVRGIAKRLIPQTAVFRKDAPEWKWEVNVLTSPEVNAWCMPGGKIAVYTGIIEKLSITDDELAAVMGHEISHALREHGRERASQQAATGVGASLAGVVADIFLPGSGQLATAGAGAAGQLAYNLPYSRLQETEADRMGVELAARAGYDPRAAIALWQKMAKLSSGGAPPQILSTHPSNDTRIKDLEVFAQRVLPLYEQARAAK